MKNKGPALVNTGAFFHWKKKLIRRVYFFSLIPFIYKENMQSCFLNIAETNNRRQFPYSELQVCLYCKYSA